MINYSELEMALEFSSAGDQFDSAAYLNKETGEIYCISDAIDEEYPDDLEENEKYQMIPSKQALGLGKPLALEFTEQYLPAEMSKIYNIFRSRGAYSAFKMRLEANDLIEKWYEYEADLTRKALLQWCDEMGFKVNPA